MLVIVFKETWRTERQEQEDESELHRSCIDRIQWRIKVKVITNYNEAARKREAEAGQTCKAGVLAGVEGVSGRDATLNPPSTPASTKPTPAQLALLFCSSTSLVRYLLASVSLWSCDVLMQSGSGNGTIRLYNQRSAKLMSALTARIYVWLCWSINS